MDLQRLGVKIFAADPESLQLRDFIPVFHTWIQKQAVDGHLLIDVHDYSHVFNGPGILLVAHEGNLSIDMAEGRPGLMYYRKQDVNGAPEARLDSILRTAFQACSMLQEESSLKSPLRFRNDELLIVANDRLQAPNEEQTFAILEPILSAVLKRHAPQGSFVLTRVSTDPKERFAVRVRAENGKFL